MNLLTNTAGSLSQMWVGSLSRVSPTLTDIGTCTFSIVEVGVGSFLYCCLHTHRNRKISRGGSLLFPLSADHHHHVSLLRTPMPRPLCSPFFGATYCVSLSLGTCLLLFGRHVGRFCLYRAGSIFGTRASGSRGIGTPSSLRGGTHLPVLAPPNARHHGRTWRDGCVFAASLLLVQATSAILEKPSVWDRKPSRTLSVAFPPFHLGNLLPFFLACRLGNGV